MLKAIKVRIYPNKEQEHYLAQLFGTSRFVYNKCLEYKKTSYDQDKTKISFGQLAKYINQLKQQEDYNWIKNSHSKVVQQSIKHLDTAYSNFFRGKGKVGFPTFKNKHSRQSVEFRKDAISKNFILGNRLNLITDLKDILFKCSIKDEKYLNKQDLNFKSATLSKTKTNNYYLSVLVEREHQIKTNNRNFIGIDLGIKDFIVTSEGETIDNPKFTRSNQLKLSRLQRELSRKQKGSNNKNKARLKLAKFHQKINNQKEYFLHQVVNKLINENQVICLEDLNVKGMLSNHKLARSVQELSLYRFKQILEYKAKWNNREIVIVDRWFPSSKNCSNCGNKKQNLTLKDRVYNCSNCGYEIDRDLNAAINIHNEGIRLIGMSCAELTPLESSSLEHSMKKEKTGFL